MKSLLFFTMALVFAGCSKETLAPTVSLMEMVDNNTAAPVTEGGSFQNGPYGSVMGKARLYKNEDNSYSVALDSFSTTNGPDLYVYLSKQAMPVNFVELGKLKSTNGSQVYNFTTTGDLTDYIYVCIHCKAFNHLFGYALLK